MAACSICWYTEAVQFVCKQSEQSQPQNRDADFAGTHLENQVLPAQNGKRILPDFFELFLRLKVSGVSAEPCAGERPPTCAEFLSTSAGEAPNSTAPSTTRPNGEHSHAAGNFSQSYLNGQAPAFKADSFGGPSVLLAVVAESSATAAAQTDNASRAPQITAILGYKRASDRTQTAAGATRTSLLKHR
jgi:hypothetical protein